MGILGRPCEEKGEEVTRAKDEENEAKLERAILAVEESSKAILYMNFSPLRTKLEQNQKEMASQYEQRKKDLEKEKLFDLGKDGRWNKRGSTKSEAPKGTQWKQETWHTEDVTEQEAKAGCGSSWEVATADPQAAAVAESPKKVPKTTSSAMQVDEEHDKNDQGASRAAPVATCVGNG